MGREIYTIIKDPNGNIVWDSADAIEGFFCGRYEETGIIAYCADCDDGLLDFTDQEVRDRIINDLQNIQDSNDRTYNRLMNRIDDLRAARCHALTVKLFDDFTDEMETLQADCDAEYWTRAGDMIQLMNRTVEVAAGYANSEMWYGGQPDLHGYRVFWVVSE